MTIAASERDLAVVRHDWTRGEVRALKCPVRVVSGGRSRAPTRRIASFLADELPSADLEVVADANHLLPVTHPGMVAAMLSRELAE